VKNQFFGAATNISSQFASIPDGMLGLGFPELSMLQKVPFFQTAIAQKVISDPVFAFFLSDTASELHLGGVNKAHFDGEIENHPLSAKSNGFWQLAGGSISVDGSEAASGFDTILETGGTLIYGQPDAVQDVYAKIPEAKPIDSVPGFYQFPCHTEPEVSFGWGGRQWNISAWQ
jgi:cathepsin D